MSRAERFSRFFVRRRHWFAVGIALVTAFFAWQMRHLEIYTQFLDLLPRGHPYIDTHEAYRDSFGSANTVYASVVAREGDLYQAEVIAALDAVTEGLDSSIVSAAANSEPASHYVTPRGRMETLVHRGVRWVDGVFHRPQDGPVPTGVEHNHTTSLLHRIARYVRVDAEGVLHSVPFATELPEDPAELGELRTRVRRSPVAFGGLVSVDEKAGLVRASFIESKLDYGALFKHIQALIRDVESRYPVKVYVSGQPMLFGWTYAFATEIVLIFLATLGVSITLLWAYFRRVFGVLLPLSGALVNVIWGLGFAAWAGFYLDPLVLVVPMLITARAISHSVQFVERFYEEYAAGGDKEGACVRSMSELLLPGTMAILTDCIGLLTISLATIPLIRNLGMLCAFWALSIAVTEMLLNRLLILYLPPPRVREHHVPALIQRALGVAAGLAVSKRGAMSIVAAFLFAAGCCSLWARDVPLGENRPGTPILYADSEFNIAAREIGQRFAGLDDLVVVAHTEIPERIFAPDTMKWVESLQRTLETAPNAGGSISYVDLYKQMNRAFRDNDPRWAIGASSWAESVGLRWYMESAPPGAGLFSAYRTRDQRALSIRVFYRDHRGETVRAANTLLRRFAEEVRLDGSLAFRLVPAEPGWLRRSVGWLAPLLPPLEPALEATRSGAAMSERVSLAVERVDARDRRGDRVTQRVVDSVTGAVAELRTRGRFGSFTLWVRPDPESAWMPRPSGVWLRDGVELRLAAGVVGTLAAANEEIAASHRTAWVVVFLATFTIVALSYQSLWIGALLVTSLGMAALVAQALQSVLGIGINVNTLPVQAIGVGVGVDYAIYIVDRVLRERESGLERVAAIERAVRTTGLAIAFTTSTLIAGIVFWIPISSLRFSAEMSLLLAVLMGINALGAILLVPAVLRLLPAHASQFRGEGRR